MTLICTLELHLSLVENLYENRCFCCITLMNLFVKKKMNVKKKKRINFNSTKNLKYRNNQEKKLKFLYY